MIFPSGPLRFYNLRREGMKWFLHHMPLVKSENLFQIFLFIQVICYLRDLDMQRIYTSRWVRKKKETSSQRQTRAIHSIKRFVFIELKPTETMCLKCQILRLFAWSRNRNRNTGYLLLCRFHASYYKPCQTSFLLIRNWDAFLAYDPVPNTLIYLPSISENCIETLNTWKNL